MSDPFDRRPVPEAVARARRLAGLLMLVSLIVVLGVLVGVVLAIR